MPKKSKRSTIGVYTTFTVDDVTKQTRIPPLISTPMKIMEGMAADFLGGMRRGFNGKIFPPRSPRI